MESSKASKKLYTDIYAGIIFSPTPVWVYTFSGRLPFWFRRSTITASSPPIPVAGKDVGVEDNCTLYLWPRNPTEPLDGKDGMVDTYALPLMLHMVVTSK